MSSIDLEKTKRIAVFPHSGILYAMALDAREGRLYGAGDDRSVHVADLNAGKNMVSIAWTNHDNYVSSLVLLESSPSRRVAITGSYDGHLNWTRLSDGKLLERVRAHDGWVRDVALLPDGERLVSVGDDMQVKLWDADSGELLWQKRDHAERTPEGYLSALYAVAVSPDGRFVASADRVGEVRIWNVETGDRLHAFRAPEFYTFDPARRVRSIGGIRGLAFSLDGERLAISGIGQVTNVDGFVGPCRVELWDWRNERRIQVGSDKHKAVLNHVAFHPTELLMVAAGGGDGGGVIGFWKQDSEKPVQLVKSKEHVQDFAFDEAGTLLFTAGSGGFEVWDLTGAREPWFEAEKAEKS